jgi:hypothetical protein
MGALSLVKPRSRRLRGQPPATGRSVVVRVAWAHPVLDEDGQPTDITLCLGLEIGFYPYQKLQGQRLESFGPHHHMTSLEIAACLCVSRDAHESLHRDTAGQKIGSLESDVAAR